MKNLQYQVIALALAMIMGAVIVFVFYQPPDKNAAAREQQLKVLEIQKRQALDSVKSLQTYIDSLETQIIPDGVVLELKSEVLKIRKQRDKALLEKQAKLMQNHELQDSIINHYK